MSGDCIYVGCVDCRYLAPRDLPAPEHLRVRLDEVVQRDFPSALVAAFPSSFPADSEELWLIRRLNINLDASGDWSSEQLAGAWAGRTASTIVECMLSSDGDPNVLHFDNQAAYLAQFLTDVAQGDVWSKWYYDHFAGLRLLSTGDALLTALSRDRDVSLRALRYISTAGFRRVLSALLAQHAEMLWRVLAPPGPIPADTRDIEEICGLRRVGPQPPLPTLEHKALWLLHRVSQSQKMEPADGALSAIRALSALEEAYLLFRAPAYEHLLAALKRADRPAVILQAGTRLAEWMEPWLDAPELVGRGDAAIRLSPTQDRSDEQVAMATTCFGALFLLLPLLAEFPAEEAAPGRSGALRFAIFRKCCPAALRNHVTRDPLVREIFHIESDEEPDFDGRLLRSLIPRWLSDLLCINGETPQRVTGGGFSILIDPLLSHWLSLDPEPGSLIGGHPDLEYFAPDDCEADRCLCVIAHGLLQNFAWKLPGFAQSSMAYLWMNFLDIQAQVQIVDDRRIVRLTPPPLHVVLAMTGLSASTYRVSWLDDRPFCLFPEA